MVFIQQVTNLFKHELGVPGGISRTQKPPALNACRKSTCLGALPAQPTMHYREFHSGPTLHSPGCICICVNAVCTCACMMVCVGVYVNGCVHEHVYMFAYVCAVCYICTWAHVNECVYVCAWVCVPQKKKKSLRKIAWVCLVGHHISHFIAPLLWEHISQ